ncbi:hypothetical protein ACFQ3N_14145, partial [Virgibacillus byunsanensis]
GFAPAKLHDLCSVAPEALVTLMQIRKFYTFLSANKSSKARSATYGLRPRIAGGSTLPPKAVVLVDLPQIP